MGEFESPGSSGDANEVALNAIGELIRQVQAGSMIQKFVLLVDVIDEDDRWISSFTAPGQKAWDTMGMLQWGLAFEQANVMGPDDE